MVVDRTRLYLAVGLWTVLLWATAVNYVVAVPAGLNPTSPRPVGLTWLEADRPLTGPVFFQPIAPTPEGMPTFPVTLTTTAQVPPVPAGPLVGWPVPGRISQAFGCSPYYSAMPGPGCPAERPWFHDGLDLAAAVGTPVRAAISGTVRFAGPDGSGPACGAYRGYGLGVVVAGAEGWQTLYAHLSRIDVTTGQAVTPETIIGAVGATGCVTGPHLHFGLRRHETLVDPLQYRDEE